MKSALKVSIIVWVLMLLSFHSKKRGAETMEKPNIIIIYTDDMGIASLFMACNG